MLSYINLKQRIDIFVKTSIIDFMERDIRRVEEIYRAGFNQYYRPYQTNPIKSRKKPEKSFQEILDEMRKMGK